jgi:hypothetical protein
MNPDDLSYVSSRIEQLKSEYLVDIFADWGDDAGNWKPGTWAREELDKLHGILTCFADCIGGLENFRQWTGGVTVKKADMGTHGGEALRHQVSLSTKYPFSAWTVVHEFAHTWDAHYNWRLSRLLERFTGGHTSRIHSWFVKRWGHRDCNVNGYERKAGRWGRLPGCNRAGYFYGDKPSGSDWNFNRVEDFAECVAMYVGWERNNDLSDHARKRIVHYELQNGEKDGFGVVDNWADYAKYFYPEHGDYQKTKRWQFIDELVMGKIKI